MTAADTADRDTIPPSPAAVDEVLAEVLAAVRGAREDMAKIGTGLAKKIDDRCGALETKVDGLASSVQDLSITVLGLDVRLGRVEEQMVRDANDRVALAARVTALETSRMPFTPAIETALVSIAESLARKMGAP